MSPKMAFPINSGRLSQGRFDARFPDPAEADAIIPLRKSLDTPDCLDRLEEADLI